jgi:hypothetical protein
VPHSLAWQRQGLLIIAFTRGNSLRRLLSPLCGPGAGIVGCTDLCGLLHQLRTRVVDVLPLAFAAPCGLHIREWVKHTPLYCSWSPRNPRQGFSQLTAPIARHHIHASRAGVSAHPTSDERQGSLLLEDRAPAIGLKARGYQDHHRTALPLACSARVCPGL